LRHHDASISLATVSAARAAPVIAKGLVVGTCTAIIIGGNAKHAFGMCDTASHAAVHGVDVGVCNAPIPLGGWVG